MGVATNLSFMVAVQPLWQIVWLRKGVAAIDEKRVVWLRATSTCEVAQAGRAFGRAVGWCGKLTKP